MRLRILCVFVAICLMASLLPLTVLAEDPSVVVNFTNPEESDSFSVTVAPGESKFVITNADKKFVMWTEENPPADNFIKLEYPADGKATLQVTLNNIDAFSSSQFFKRPSIAFTPGEYSVVINLVGNNKLTNSLSSCIFYEGIKNMTITGPGNLTMLNTSSVDGSIWGRGGDLLIQDTTLDITVTSSTNSNHNAILLASGNVTLDKVKITYSLTGGCLVFMGTFTEKVGRKTVDTATDRFITIKDSEISGSANLCSFRSTTPCTIINSTLTIIKNSTRAKICPEYAIFCPAPNLEGEYTALAGMAKSPEKAKEFNVKKLESYTYFSLTPGKAETVPETTVATIPETTVATIPETTVATTPETTVDTTPDVTTDAAADNNSGTPMKIVFIIAAALIVAAGGAAGVILYTKKKKA